MPKRFDPEKCPVYLRVPWIKKASIGLDKNVKTTVESCYGSVTTKVIFTSKCMLPVARKDALPTTPKSSVVYEYSCHCDSRYVERPTQRLQDTAGAKGLRTQPFFKLKHNFYYIYQFLLNKNTVFNILLYFLSF